MPDGIDTRPGGNMPIAGMMAVARRNDTQVAGDLRNPGVRPIPRTVEYDLVPVAEDVPEL